MIVKQIDDLLTELEHLTAEALKAAESAEEADFYRSIDLVAERGKLVRQLNSAIARSGPLSYVEFNRMVVIHRQGAEIEARVAKMRQGIEDAISASERQRAFADSLTRALQPVPVTHQVEL